MIRFSVFENTVSRDPVMMEMAWPAFIDLMGEWFADQRPATKDEKMYRTPLVSPAVYGEGGTRRNDNVQSFGGWFALDVDTSGVTVDEAKAILEAVPTDYLVYTTTSSKADNERYRVCFPLDREVQPHEMKAMWAGAFEFFGGITDPQTKDASRIFNVPATWEGSSPRFEARCDGAVVSVDELLSYAPPEPEPVTLVLDAATLKRMQKAIAGDGKTIQPFEGVLNSKVVKSKYVDEYLALNKGEHHVGLYSFMSKVALRALSLGYTITVDDLARFARELDMLTPLKRDKQRWSRIHSEATNALRWAHQTYSQKAIFTQ